MARKIANITSSDSAYTLLSQTPKNYDTNNFFVKELQDKVNAEWPYRANRVDVEVEHPLGSSTWLPLEVIVQTVKTDNTEAISNDRRRFVFKNIRESRFNLGHKFRFAPDYNPNAPIDSKDTWLVINFNQIKLTNSVVAQRCNGTLGSAYIDEQGVTHYHYEPVVQGIDLSAVNFFYNETMVAQQSQLIVVAQHNEFTKKYFVNQRFIIGYDKIYKLKAINKFYANSTNNPYNVGLIKMYFEITEDTNEYDDFINRIAYQGEPAPYVIPDEEYQIRFSQPTNIPEFLTAGGLTFVPQLYRNGELVSSASFTVSYTLENLPESVSKDRYVQYTNNGDGSFTFKRLREYLNGNLIITWSTVNAASDTVTSIMSFVMLDI